MFHQQFDWRFKKRLCEWLPAERVFAFSNGDGSSCDPQCELFEGFVHSAGKDDHLGLQPKLVAATYQ